MVKFVGAVVDRHVAGAVELADGVAADGGGCAVCLRALVAVN